MPAPDSATITGEVDELFTRVRLPEKLLTVVGENLTVKEEEPPGATVSGKTRPEEPKPVQEIERRVTLRLAVPGLRIVTV